MADKLRTFDAPRVAREIYQHLEAAVGDIASDMLSPHGGLLDDEWKKKIAAVKKNKRHVVTDLQGWLADELFNDRDTIQDTIGDRIHDACSSKEQRIDVLDALIKTGHSALVAACQVMKREEQEAN